MTDSSSKLFFSFSVNYAVIVRLVDLIVLLGSKLLNCFRKFSTLKPTSQHILMNIQQKILLSGTNIETMLF